MIFTCDRFKVPDSGDMEQTCLPSGQLDGTAPTCVEAEGQSSINIYNSG